MIKTIAETTMHTIKTSCCYGVLLIIFIASLLFLPYELFFVSALIILFALHSLENNIRQSSTEMDHKQHNVMNRNQ